MRMRRRDLLQTAGTGIAAAVAANALGIGPVFGAGATVVTVAGTADGTPFTGDGQPATRAGLGDPVALAVGAGAAYLGERVLAAKFQSVRSIVRRFDFASSTVERVAGTGSAAYMFDEHSGWTRTKPMVGSDAPSSVLSFVGGLASLGNFLYATLSDADGSGVVVRIDPSARSIALVAGGGADPGNESAATAAALFGPAGLVVLGNGDLLFAEFGANRIRLVTTGGRILTIAGGNLPRSVAAVEPSKPLAIRVDPAVGDGGPARDAILSGPQNLALGANGSVYVSESVGHRVRVIDGVGRITTFAGTGTSGFSGDGGPATAARLFAPHGLAVDASGNVFIADSFNHRVRKVSGAVISTVAGNGERGYGGDGGSATAAAFSRPGALALLPGGAKLLVADEGNRVIRQVSLT